MDNFNLTGEALRNLLILAVDVSEGASEPVWEIQGYKTEDASIEMSPEITTVTDILGDTYTDVDKFQETVTFEPNTLRMGAKLSELMLKYWRGGHRDKLSQFRVLIGYGFLGSDGAYEADTFSQSTVVPNSLGGSSRVNMPFSVNLGGTRTRGTIDKLRGSNIKFTPTVVV